MKNNRSLLLQFSKDNKIDFNIVLKYYAFERFLFRVANSKYKNILILKGGFFLLSYTNVYQRITRDIDLSVLDYELSFNSVKEIINELISINIDDEISFAIKNIDYIKEVDEYYGLRVKLQFKVFGISDVINIDLETGDVITPKPIKRTYHSIINNSSFNIMTYSIETYLSEKLETILSKLENNSRMKDYYDIYFLTMLFSNNINKRVLKMAINNTFNNRRYINEPFESLKIIENSIILKKYWSMYRNKNEYAKNINFEDVTKILEKYISFIDKKYKKANFYVYPYLKIN